MIDDPFLSFAVILVLAAFGGLIAAKLHQPVVIAFIGVGVLVGPVGLGLVDGDEPINLFAKLGISLLLFLVGLKLDLHLVRSTGLVALATGLGQVVFTSAIGFVIARALGMGTTIALYVAVALTFSSTIIIIKLLSDKREIDQLHGRIAVGFLIVQDIVVVLVMIVLTAIGEAGSESLVSEFGVVLLKGVGLIVGMLLLMRWVLPRVLHEFAAKSELFVLFGVTWAVMSPAASMVMVRTSGSGSMSGSGAGSTSGGSSWPGVDGGGSALGTVVAKMPVTVPARNRRAITRTNKPRKKKRSLLG